jgi:biotin carboxyl carrier protein
MDPIFEYDVFLSFAISDEEFVKPIWQELCLSGLRVFWSDAALKKELGNSWYATIESSLGRSRHMLLVCSSASMNSIWVQREYIAFQNHCYKPGVRRLIPVLIQGYEANDLPLFLRELEATKFGELDSLQEIIMILGGVNIEELRQENQSLRQNVELLKRSKLSLEQEVRQLTQRLQVDEPLGEPESDNTPHDDESQSDKQGAFEFLGLSPDARSQQISQRYIALKEEYEALLHSCPKPLKQVCVQRLQALETAFWMVFPERRTEEDDKTKKAYEVLQLPKDTIHRSTIRKRFRELKTDYLKAMQSSDRFIKQAAAKELEELEAALTTLVPIQPLAADDESHAGMVEVVMPQMGEQMAEGTITKWLKAEGERVERDEPLFEISTDKVDAEIPSPAAGVLKEILFAEAEVVPANIVVALIEPAVKVTI